MTLEVLNNLSYSDRFDELFRCCGSTFWATKLNDSFPFSDVESLKRKSDTIWSNISKSDILEAFTHHPKIGDIESLTKKFATTQQWASGEQAGISAANIELLELLAKGNSDYENKFGYIFIICATGKTAQEMLNLLLERLSNNADIELKIAAIEQNKITHIRIEKLIS